MTEPDAGPPVDPAGPVRRPPSRVDPAAMRDTLDAARRRLGQAGHTTDEARSAEQLRALLREAAADQAVPPDPRARPSSPPPADAGPRPEPIV